MPINWLNRNTGNLADVSQTTPLPVQINDASTATSGVADQALTVDATIGGVSFAAFNAASNSVFWTLDAAQCRFTLDGSAPTATNGHVINPGDSGTWPKALAATAKFIRTTATSGVISATELK